MAKTPAARRPWTEASVARALIHSHIFHRGVLAIPNCGWTGSETDLLVVTKDLRLVDVEIKISRADLKADIRKDKWWVKRPWARTRQALPTMRRWPDKIWKHYYAVPAEIWDDKLLEAIPEDSGVLLMYSGTIAAATVSVKRRAKPNAGAKPICAADAIDLARLAGLRMWDAITRSEAMRISEG